MSDRARVLSQIRSSLRDVPPDENGEARDSARSTPEDGRSVELFVERVEEYRGAVHRASADDIAALVRELSPGEGRLLLAPGVDAGWLPDGTSTVVDSGFSAVELEGFDGVLTGCLLAIADTGTIVLDGGPLSGRHAISLVPDLHVCVVQSDQIVGSVPEAMARLKEDGRDRSPLTFVSGPSATSDIEFRRVEGVHGPRRLEVILVGGS